MFHSLEDNVICALATPMGRGAVAMVRVSGNDALKTVASLLDEPKKSEILNAEGYTLHYAEVSAHGELLDQVVLAVFRAPHSYTGEDSVEITCHCSQFIITELLDLLCGAGAKLAEPGEFTKRAFLNGKMDLAQAESVADLIESETAAAHRIAMNQMKGGFSKELAAMREQMLKLVSLMELELDFSEEDVEFADRSELKQLLDAVTARIDSLMAGFRLGNAIKNGVPVAIVGATNTGKSTLLNLLLGEERAIVSSISGTTRDSIEDTVNIDGILFRFIDTAGIRNTTETIELIGIERTFYKIRQAQVVMLVLDSGHPENFEESIKSLQAKLQDTGSYTDAESVGKGWHKDVILLLNKCDLTESGMPGSAAEVKAYSAAKDKAGSSAGIGSPILSEMLESVRKTAAESGLSPLAVMPISALKEEGISELRKVLSDSQNSLRTAPDQTLITNMRHYEALRSANEALARVKDGLAQNLSTDLLTQDLREAIFQIGTITGTIQAPEVLDNIFKNFCIGK